MTLGPDLGSQSQPRQCNLDNNDFPKVVDRFMLEVPILRRVSEGKGHQERKNTLVSVANARRAQPPDASFGPMRNR